MAYFLKLPSFSDDASVLVDADALGKGKIEALLESSGNRFQEGDNQFPPSSGCEKQIMVAPSTPFDQRELLQQAERYLPGVALGMMVLPADLRMVMVRGQGSKIYDADGKEYIDYMLGSGPLVLGHCRPEVVEAVQRQAALGSTYFALNEPAIRLAETIAQASPCGEAIRFQTTGSEATFAALRLARAFTRRDKVLKFEGGWHGGHDLGQLSGAPSEPPPFPEAAPDCDGITDAARHDVLVAPFNDLETTVAIIEQHHRDLAAVIVEPLQRALKPEPAFLEGVRELTRKYGIVLVFDEIVTGFRLAWGGGQERYGVSADLACYGKVIGGGYPLSAVAGNREILQLADPQQKGKAPYCFLSGTLTANPIACAAGLATLTVLRQAGVFERLHHVGQRLAHGLRQAAAEAVTPLQVLGDGPVLQVVFVDGRPLSTHRDLLRADKKKAVAFAHGLIRRGVYCTPGGKLYLSLAHSDEDIDRTAAIASKVLRELI
jgi:glutamate-1-semialdehyde 2,1-aminomutase